MKALVVSDIHSAFRRLKRIIFAENFDVIVVCGDITDFAPNHILQFLEVVADFTCIAVHGNCDPPEAVSILQNSDIYFIHGRSVKLDGITFHGLGGSNLTPFFTPSEYSEDEISTTASNFTFGEYNVLVTHCPPKGILDFTYTRKRAGSKAIAEIVEKFEVILCGHIHEARGIEKRGFLAVNPGSVSAGRYAVVDLKEKEAELKQI
jgi:hypothetical protein